MIQPAASRFVHSTGKHVLTISMKFPVYVAAALLAAVLSGQAIAKENYIVTETASAHAKPAKDSASDHSFATGDVIAVLSCAKGWCTTENEKTWVEATRIKPVRQTAGSVEVPGWGHIPQSMYQQAMKNCGGADAGGCLCQDGAAIGACGD